MALQPFVFQGSALSARAVQLPPEAVLPQVHLTDFEPQSFALRLLCRSGFAAHLDVPAKGKSAPMFGFEDSITLGELVHAAQGGDELAFTQLIERYRSRVIYWAYGVLGDWSEAEDIFQEVSIRAWQRLGQLEKAEALIGWLRTMTHRMAYSRQGRRVVQVDSDLSAADRMESREDSSLDSLLVKDTQEEVRESLQRLCEIDRETLVAYYIEELSIKEMSVAFAAPLGTIKRRLHVARHRLAKQIQSTLSF